MPFAPGQFITAQRLNRLQPKTYWAAATGGVATSLSGVDVPGTSIPITIETDGATISFVWIGAIYATTSTTGATTVRVNFDGNLSPTFVVSEPKDASTKVTAANTWSFTVATAGAYTPKLVATTQTGATISTAYTSIMATVTEVV